MREVLQRPDLVFAGKGIKSRLCQDSGGVKDNNTCRCLCFIVFLHSKFVHPSVNILTCVKDEKSETVF